MELLRRPWKPGSFLQSTAWHSLSIRVSCVKDHMPLPHPFNIHAWRHLFECAGPACLPQLPVVDLTLQRFTVHSGKRYWSYFFSQLRCAVGAAIRFCIVGLLHHLHSFKTFVIRVKFLFSKPEKSQFTFRKKTTTKPKQKERSKPQTQPKLPNRKQKQVFYARSKWHLSHSGFTNVQFPWFHITTAGFLLSKRENIQSHYFH